MRKRLIILIRVGLRNLRVRRKVSKVLKVLCFFIRLFSDLDSLALLMCIEGGEIFSSQRGLECALLLNSFRKVARIVQNFNLMSPQLSALCKAS